MTVPINPKLTLHQKGTSNYKLTQVKYVGIQNVAQKLSISEKKDSFAYLFAKTLDNGVLHELI